MFALATQMDPNNAQAQEELAKINQLVQMVLGTLSSVAQTEQAEGGGSEAAGAGGDAASCPAAACRSAAAAATTRTSSSSAALRIGVAPAAAALRDRPVAHEDSQRGAGGHDFSAVAEGDALRPPSTSR